MPTDATPEFYLPADIAKILKCSEWWVKEQARRGRIPFCWIGGGYRFTPGHLMEIARIFERRSTTPDAPPSGTTKRHSRRSPAQRQNTATNSPTPLSARIPPRARRTSSQENEAA